MRITALRRLLVNAADTSHLSMLREVNFAQKLSRYFQVQFYSFSCH